MEVLLALIERTWCLQVVKLKAFSKFENTTEALAAATALVDSKLSKGKRSTTKGNGQRSRTCLLHNLQLQQVSSTCNQHGSSAFHQLQDAYTSVQGLL